MCCYENDLSVICLFSLVFRLFWVRIFALQSAEVLSSVRVSPLLASSFSCSSPLPQSKTGSHCLICDLKLVLSLIFLAQFCLAGNTVQYFKVFFPSVACFSWHISWSPQNNFYLLNLDVERLHWKLKIKSIIMPSSVMIKNLALKLDFFPISIGLSASLPWWDFQNAENKEVLELLEPVGDILVVYMLHLLFITNQIRACLIQFDFKWLLSVWRWRSCRGIQDFQLCGHGPGLQPHRNPLQLPR